MFLHSLGKKFELEIKRKGEVLIVLGGLQKPMFWYLMPLYRLNEGRGPEMDIG